VIFAAIGRRLGYPIRLVQSREHIFCRWRGADGERFNIEATDQGYYRTPDEHYHNWPRPTFQKALREGLFLTDLTPRQEVGLFLQLRGSCLLWNLCVEEALDALTSACELHPKDYFCRNLAIIAEMLCQAKQGDNSLYAVPNRDPVFWSVPESCEQSNPRLYERACDVLVTC
jgi:hypothetical protein